jgi:hypothetical protein
VLGAVPDATLIQLAADAAGNPFMLAGRGVPCLRHATAQLTDPWVRSSATEDQGVLLARSGDEDEAARVFDEALRGYASIGAGRDDARIRRRLRKLGIRRRHWSTGKRPATGWESLTDTELATSRLELTRIAVEHARDVQDA